MSERLQYLGLHPNMKPSSGLKNFALLLLSVGVGLLFAEMVIPIIRPSALNGIRLFDYLESERGKFCRYDPLLGWDGVPSAVADFQWVDCRCRVRQNKSGYRGRDYEFTRSDHKRILFLGDSFLWGFGVNNEEIFTSLVEKESRPPVEVINLGVSGYGTDQELLLWRTKGESWKPDEVWLLINFQTDLYDNISMERYGYPKPAFQIEPGGGLKLINVPVPARSQPWGDPAKRRQLSARSFLIRHSASASLLASTLARYAPARAFLQNQRIIPAQSIGDSREAPLYQVPNDSTYESGWNLMAGLIAAFKQDVEQQHARLKLVLVPSFVQVYPEAWNQFQKAYPLSAGKQWDLTAPLRRIQAIGRSQGLEVLNLLPDLENIGRRNHYLYFPNNIHWTVAGHRVVADAVERSLRLAFSAPKAGNDGHGQLPYPANGPAAGE